MLVYIHKQLILIHPHTTGTLNKTDTRARTHACTHTHTHLDWYVVRPVVQMVTTTEGGVLLSHVHLQVLEELDVLKMEEER